MAKDLKLVDQIGGKNAALAAAAKLVKLDKYKIVEYPKKKDAFMDIIKQATGGNRDVALVKEYLGDDYKLLEQIKQIRKQRNTIQAVLPYNFEIK